MPDLVDRRLEGTFALYDELLAALDSQQLRTSLPVPSNPIGMQLWCVVGARETWARAMASGTWGPFGCSIAGFADTHDAEMMRAKIAASAEAVRAAVAASADDDTRTDLKLGLLEHENQHLGQLVRYLLGLEIAVPPGWKARFAL